MERYRTHYQTHGGTSFGVQQFVARDDAAAIEYASKKLRSPWGMGHEIWQEQRLVHREIYP
jgi:hypothetical protein